MSERSFFQIQSKFLHLFIVVLLCLGYFNYSVVAELVVIFFQMSSLTGQILVNKFLTICKSIFELIKLICLFFQILYEDSLIFWKDANEKLTFVIYLLKELYLLMEEFGCKLPNIVLQVVETVSNFLELLHQTTGTVKRGVHHSGANIWHFFTNIPKIMIYNIIGITEFIKNSFNEIIISVFKLQERITQTLEKAHLFLFDIPLDSVYGLIISTILLTILCVKFKDICYLLASTLLKLYEQVISIALNLWSGQFLGSKTRRNVNYNNENDERLCIVCQYQLKEVIIFPCKHLCLCNDCSKQLVTNQAVCPLCRSDILDTLKIYI